MDPVCERVGVLVVRITVAYEDELQPARILVTTVDRLAPAGEPSPRERYVADGIDDALIVISRWLRRLAPPAAR